MGPPQDSRNGQGVRKTSKIRPDHPIPIYLYVTQEGKRCMWKKKKKIRSDLLSLRNNYRSPVETVLLQSFVNDFFNVHLLRHSINSSTGGEGLLQILRTTLTPFLFWICPF